MWRMSPAAASSAVTVSLVDDEDVSPISRIPALAACIPSPSAQREEHDGRVRQPRHLDLYSARRRRLLDQDDVTATASSTRSAWGVVHNNSPSDRDWPSSGCRHRGPGRGENPDAVMSSAPRRRARTGTGGPRPAGRASAGRPADRTGRGRLPDPRAARDPDDVGTPHWARGAITSRRAGEPSSTSEISARDGPWRSCPQPPRRGQGRRPTMVACVARFSGTAGRSASPAPPPHSARTDTAAATLEFEGQVKGDPGAGHADRVTESDGAAVDVDLVRRPGRLLGRDEPDRGERLVDLDQVEAAGSMPSFRRPCDRARRLGLQRRVRPGDDTVRADLGQPAQPESRPWPCSSRRRRGAVGDLRRRPGRDGAVLAERGSQPAQRSRSWCRRGYPRRCRETTARPCAAAPTGTTSSSKTPFFHALAARWWLARTRPVPRVRTSSPTLAASRPMPWSVNTIPQTVGGHMVAHRDIAVLEALPASPAAAGRSSWTPNPRPRRSRTHQRGIRWSARAIASMPDGHTLLMVSAGTGHRDAGLHTAWRAGTWPARA